MAKTMLFDSSKCIACRGCQSACKQWWELPAVTTGNRGSYENPPTLGPGTWNKIRFQETTSGDTVRWLFTRQACMHCTEAPCVWTCPTYARTYTPSGAVTIDRERCIGCGRCVEFCPFDIPRLGAHDITPRIQVGLSTPRQVAHKCGWCQDRLDSGQTPACVKTCPPGALQFGERSEIIQRGQARVDALKATLPKAHLYGENEMGGLHVVYVLTDTTTAHALPEDPHLGEYSPFDATAFPEWYILALRDGTIPRFPANAKRQWYMEPDLAPTTPVGALKGLATPRSRKDFFDGREALAWGWLGVGVVGAGAALAWIHKRRNGNGLKSDSDNEPVARGSRHD